MNWHNFLNKKKRTDKELYEAKLEAYRYGSKEFYKCILALNSYCSKDYREEARLKAIELLKNKE